MADKTYRMTVTLSDGSIVDAGTFVAPQGPKGDTGTIPEALPQEASALKSGNLPTSGWGVSASLWTGSVVMPYRYGSYVGKYIGNVGKSWASSEELLAELPDGWQATINGVLYTKCKAEYSDYEGGGIIFIPVGYYDDGAYVRILPNGDIHVWNNSAKTRTITQVGCSRLSKQTYTISDTSITANSDVLMELTDEGGVKSYSMEAGKITVIRGTVPTNPIPYTYKVKQTNASGQFTVINHYVPKVEIPTRTSELENDSGYVSNLPTVQNVVCNDVKGATTLDTTITCEIGDLILAQIIVRSALTLPTDWTLLRTIPAVETSVNQTLSFAYKRATSTSETLTVTQATAGRIYTNLVRLSNAVSVSYIQSCEKTGTGIKSISSTKPVTPNMVIWGVSSDSWNASSPYGDWTYAPSTLDYYSLPQTSKQPRLGTFVDSSGAGERTFTSSVDSADSMMCGAVEIVGDEVARKGDIPSAGEWVTVTGTTATLTEAGTYQVWRNLGGQILVYWDGQTQSSCTLPCVSFLVNDNRPYIHKHGASITADGVLSMTHESMTTDGTTNWTQSAVETESGFKYRKIN